MPATTTILGTYPDATPIRIGCPQVEEPATGWDVLRELLWLPSRTALAKGSVRSYDGGTFYVQDQRIVEYRGGFPVAEVISLGFATENKPAKWHATGSVSEDVNLMSLDNGLALTGILTIWRMQFPRVTKQYLSTTLPSIPAFVGRPAAPEWSAGYDPQPWFWALFPSGAWYARGWVGESRTPDVLPGTSVCLVTDTYTYDPGYLDRNDLIEVTG